MFFVTLARAQQVHHAARKDNLDIAGRTSQLFYTAASRLMCVTPVALPEKPGKISIVGCAMLYCGGCGLAVWPYSTGHSKTVLYGEYTTGGAFESPTQSTISKYILANALSILTLLNTMCTVTCSNSIFEE